MNTESHISTELAELELIEENLKLTSAVLGINLYTSQSFYNIPEALLHTFKLFLDQCPASELKFYATETMKAHKPVTNRVMGMLKAWMAPDAPQKHYIALELKKSLKPQDAPSVKYEVWSTDASDQANIVSISLPATLETSKADNWVAFVCQLADIFPFRCGQVGFTLECSRYDKRRSEAHAWSKSMRHLGVDIVRLPYDAKAVGSQGVKGVGWLTLLGKELSTELGGKKMIRKQLSKDIEIIECNHGLVLKAGEAPSLGDINKRDTLPLYSEIYWLLAPKIKVSSDNSMVFAGLKGDKVELTKKWYTRFAS